MCNNNFTVFQNIKLASKKTCKSAQVEEAPEYFDPDADMGDLTPLIVALDGEGKPESTTSTADPTSGPSKVSAQLLSKRIPKPVDKFDASPEKTVRGRGRQRAVSLILELFRLIV